MYLSTQVLQSVSCKNRKRLIKLSLTDFQELQDIIYAKYTRHLILEKSMYTEYVFQYKNDSSNEFFQLLHFFSDTLYFFSVNLNSTFSRLSFNIKKQFSSLKLEKKVFNYLLIPQFSIERQIT